MIVEQLAHLGVGQITIIDYDVVKTINLNRIVGATTEDAHRREKKIHCPERLVRKVDATIDVEAIDGDIGDEPVAHVYLRATSCSSQATRLLSRLVINAMVHRFLIPAIQIGAKVESQHDGRAQVYVAVRPVFPDHGCLECASLIDPMKLQEEARSDEETTAQNHLDLPDVVDPAVISLNGIAASNAITVMLLWATGLAEQATLEHRLFFPRTGDVYAVGVAQNPECLFCSASTSSMFARGNFQQGPAGQALPVDTQRGRSHAKEMVAET